MSKTKGQTILLVSSTVSTQNHAPKAIHGIVIDATGAMQPKQLLKVPEGCSVRNIKHAAYLDIPEMFIFQYDKIKGQKINEIAMKVFGFSERHELRGAYFVFRGESEPDLTVKDIQTLLAFGKKHPKLFAALSFYCITQTDTLLVTVLALLYNDAIEKSKEKEKVRAKFIQAHKDILASCAIRYRGDGSAIDPKDVPGLPVGWQMQVKDESTLFVVGPRKMRMHAAAALSIYAVSMIEKQTWTTWNWIITK